MSNPQGAQARPSGKLDCFYIKTVIADDWDYGKSKRGRIGVTEAARDEIGRCDALVSNPSKEIAVPRCAKRNERDGGLSEGEMIERSCPLAGKTEARRAEGRTRDAERWRLVASSQEKTEEEAQ